MEKEDLATELKEIVINVDTNTKATKTKKRDKGNQKKDKSDKVRKKKEKKNVDRPEVKELSPFSIDNKIYCKSNFLTFFSYMTSDTTTNGTALACVPQN
jgi:hypothetical protein